MIISDIYFLESLHAFFRFENEKVSLYIDKEKDMFKLYCMYRDFYMFYSDNLDKLFLVSYN